MSQVGLGPLTSAPEVIKLRESIEEFNREANKQSRTMINLTWAILALTLVMTALVGWQIYLVLSRH
jgi:hypothetical protein